MNKLVLPFILLITCLNASSQTFQWAHGFGSSHHDELTGIATDKHGNIIVVGTFYDSVDFDAGVGTTKLKSTAYNDVFIRKTDASGRLLWAKQIGGNGADRGLTVHADTFGNIYVMCIFTDSVDMNPDTGINNVHKLYSGGNEAVALVKLDTAGKFVWAAGGPSTDKFAGNCDFALDKNDNVYMTYAYISSLMQEFRYATVEKLDATGISVWKKDIKSEPGISFRFIEATSIAINSNNDVILAGDFSGPANFDPNGSHIVNSIMPNVFVLKLDSNGNFIFVKAMNSVPNGFSGSYDIATDANDNILVGGYFGGKVDFDPDTSVQQISAPSAHGTSMFLLKLSAGGSYIWANSYGENGHNGIHAITTDSVGNIFATGRFEGQCYFKKSAPVVQLATSSNPEDAFVLKTDGQGDYQWVHHIGGTSLQRGRKIAVSTTGDVYACGTFQGSTNFTYNYPTSFLISSNGFKDDIYMVKIGECTPIDTTVTIQSGIITANESNASYQWLDCGTSQPITGATGKSYTVVQTGYYALAITKGLCTDTTTCYSVAVGINDIVTGKISVYPNPTTGRIQVKLNKEYHEIKIILLSTIGEKLSEHTYHNSTNIDLDINGPQGLYYIRVIIPNKPGYGTIVSKVK